MATGTPSALLAIETASPFGGLALVGLDGLPVGEIHWRSGKPHSVGLAPAVGGILELAGLGLPDLAGVAVSMGPGSFTGLRIGLSLAKGLCFGNGLPLVPVPTLAAVAAGTGVSGYPVRIMMNARRDEVYTALFSRAGSARMKRLEPDRACPPGDILSAVSEPTIFAGDWSVANRERIRRRLGDRAIFPPGANMLPSAVQVGALGVARLRRGRLPDPGGLAPLYVRASEAEVKWKERRPGR